MPDSPAPAAPPAPVTSPHRPWRGVLVATALPLREDLGVDYDRYAEHCAWLVANGCDGVVPNGSLGEYQVLTPEERARVVETAVAAIGGERVMPGVAAYGSAEARRWTEQAGEAGCSAVMLLPPNAYRADERAVVAHYAEVAAAGLPVVAYNNPIDTKVDLVPELLARLHGEGHIHGVKEFSGDVRRAYRIAELAPDLDLLIGADDVLLELAVAGAKGWVAGYPNALPKSSVELYRAAVAGDLTAALPSTVSFIRSCAGTPASSSSRRSNSRWTSWAATAVAAAHLGSRCRRARRRPSARPPRRPSRRVWRNHRHSTSRLIERAVHAQQARPARRRLAHRGHAHPCDHRRDRHHPRRDDERAPTVLPRTPRRRQAVADERAAGALRHERRDPPAATRPDCDWGVLYIEVSGYLPMCGHGTIGVATVLVETGMVEVVEPVTTIRLDTPAGPVVAEVTVEDGAATSVTLRNVPSFAVALDRRATLPDGRTVTYDLAYGGNFYAILPLEEFGLPFDRARKDDILRAGLSLMEVINSEGEPVHPEDPSIRGCHHVHLYAPGATARRSRHAMAIHPGWFDRSPCGTGTSARMAQLHARGNCLCTPSS